MHPLHFNQVYLEDLAPANTCASPVLQHSWQEADRVGREEIAQAIQDAESLLSDYLGYKLLPTWEVDELFRYRRRDFDRGQIQITVTDKKHFISGGIEAKTAIQVSAAITYSDSDGDGYDETATIIVATTVTDVEEIALYYPGELGADEWEIRPITVTISGGNATITCRREQLVDPDLMESYSAEGVDGLIDANFLATVDVYRHWNDPQKQVQFIWERYPNNCDCGLNSCPMCNFSTQYGCLVARDPKLGILLAHPANWDSTDEEFDNTSFSVGRHPDRCRIWYRAGYRNMKFAKPHLQMDVAFERAVAYLALSQLDRPLCACNSLLNFTRQWASDLSINIATEHGSTSYQFSDKVLDNPLGTTKGAIYAWNVVSKRKIGEAVYA